MSLPYFSKSSSSYLAKNNMPIHLYTSEQICQMEQDWFAFGYDSFALMQQAAWQMTQHIIIINDQQHHSSHQMTSQYSGERRQAIIGVGKGNNGGDGWLIALYLKQLGWQVHIITVGLESAKDSNDSKSESLTEVSDSSRAQKMAVAAGCAYQRFEDIINYDNEHNNKVSKDTDDIRITALNMANADIYIDALFGIGLNRAPSDNYHHAIQCFNEWSKRANALVVAVDVPSGLVASTGQVFNDIAVQADITLCLIARKAGLHIKDGADYAGEVIDIALIPYSTTKPVATLLNQAYPLSPRQQNSHKGSYGHVLVIGGNQVNGSQGMGGAAILASASAMAAGAGKITVACHQAFHGALITSLPDAMTIDLQHEQGVTALIEQASVIAIGMGLGRDDKAKALFIHYIKTAMTEKKTIIVDADGLFHLASLQRDNHKLVSQLRDYSREYSTFLTPHSGEAARLLNKEVKDIESNRLAAIKDCAKMYGGSWILKGTGSLILEQDGEQAQIYVCGRGNAGMATAGMGDVLSGVIAGLSAQTDLKNEQSSLRQAALIHSLAADWLVKPQSVEQYHIKPHQTIDYKTNHIQGTKGIIGIRGLQAQDMPVAIRQVMHGLCESS